jgi:hypothetical protein
MINIYELDESGEPISGKKQQGLTYSWNGKKLTINRPSNSEYIADTRYRVIIKEKVLLDDNGKDLNDNPITYDFTAITADK